MNKVVPVVAIDGPSGAGKGTVAQRVADELGYSLLDSGALYRLSALTVIANGIDTADHQAVVDAAARMKVRFESIAGQGVRTWLDGADVSLALRNEQTAAIASQVAAIPLLRSQLLEVQRNFRELPGLVADGRDMGTVVFPDAPVKIFLTASAEIRAERRFRQLKAKGVSVTLGSLLDEISERDERDSSRAIAPLKPAKDSIVLDSTALSIDEVCQQVLEIVREKVQ